MPSRGVAFQLLERHTTTGQQPGNVFSFQIVTSVMQNAPPDILRRRGVDRCSLGWTGVSTQGVHPPSLAAALYFFLERWSFASAVIRFSCGSPTYAELAPIAARHVAACETVDCLQKSENIRASESVGYWRLVPDIGHR